MAFCHQPELCLLISLDLAEALGIDSHFLFLNFHSLSTYCCSSLSLHLWEFLCCSILQKVSRFSASSALSSLDTCLTSKHLCVVLIWFLLFPKFQLNWENKLASQGLYCCSLFTRLVISDSLWPHGLQHARVPCPSPTPGVYSDSRPLSRWCHPTISSSVVPISSCTRSFPILRSFPMSWLFPSGGQSTGASASVLCLSICLTSISWWGEWNCFSVNTSVVCLYIFIMI